MIRERAREFTSLAVIADIMLMTSSYLIASVLFPLHLFSTEHYLLVMTSTWAIMISMTLCCLYFNHAYESMRAKSLSKIFAETLMATIQAFCAVVALLFIYKLKDVSRGFMLVYFASFFLLVLSRRVFQVQLLRRIRRNGRNYISILVVGANKTARRFIMMVDLYRDLGFKVIGLLSNEQYAREPKINPDIPVIGTFKDLDAILKKNVVDRVVFACRDDELPFNELKDHLQICEEYGVPTTMMSRFANTRYHNVTLENLGRMNLLTFTQKNIPLYSKLIKQTLDSLVSATAVVTLMPIMAVIAIAIKLDSPGPVLFKQKRYGLNGRLFNVLKFRTMCVDAEQKKETLDSKNEMSGPVFKIKGDPRITRIGKILRKYSLDELPQFLNVLTGEMSLVGPRPLPTYEIEKLERRHMRRLSVKPGITCLWQVSGRNNIGFDDWMKLDMKYIDNRTLRMDFFLLFKTFSAFFRGTGM
jgi:exopolysaccharide biosynthesis polyprenyl glycosylphosphotransferase